MRGWRGGSNTGIIKKNKEMLSIQWQSPGSGSGWPGLLTGQSVTGVAGQEG